ncbi:MAG TPA: PilZ domain-containing protein [Candidatus Acidoferrum sp.]|nr:PilZ domain-containing protein [Candidatus Acidoferrum sp.]
MGEGKFLLPRWGRLGRQVRAENPGPARENRRAVRVRVSLPVLLYGRADNEPFTETTETINVSAHGGLVPLRSRVNPSQNLILTNLQTNQELKCRVARLVRGRNGDVLAGLEFLQHSPSFWGHGASGRPGN